MTTKLQIAVLSLFLAGSLGQAQIETIETRNIAENLCPLPYSDPFAPYDYENTDNNAGETLVVEYEPVDISCATADGVTLAVDILAERGFEPEDLFRFSYKVDDGAYVPLFEFTFEEILFRTTITANNIVGSMLHLKVEVRNSSAGEVHSVKAITVSQSPPLSVDDFENIDISVYPNPVSDALHINLEEGITYSVSLINILGKEVLNQTNLNGESTFNVQNLQPGVYFANISSSTSSTTKKVIIK